MAESTEGLRQEIARLQARLEQQERVEEAERQQAYLSLLRAEELYRLAMVAEMERQSTAWERIASALEQLAGGRDA